MFVRNHLVFRFVLEIRELTTEHIILAETVDDSFAWEHQS